MDEEKHPSNGRVPLRVLFVEDSPKDLKLIQATLEGAGYHLLSSVVESLSAFQEQVLRSDHQIILSDYNLRDWTALEVLETVKRSDNDIPVIVISGTLGDEAAAEVMKQGATDYILKDRLARLPAAIQRALEDKSLRDQRKLGQEQLQESEERFRLLVDTVKDYAIFMLDVDGNVGTWNAGAERIVGYRTAEIMGQNISCFYPADDRARGKPELALRNAMNDGKWENEGWLIRKDGSQFWANTVITAMRNAQGQTIGFSNITRDLTKRKLAEDRAKLHLDRLAALRAIDIAITSSLDIRLTLRVFLDQVTTQLGVDAADVLLLDAKTQTLEFAASRGMRSSRAFRTSVNLSDDPAARAVLERRAITIADVDTTASRFKDASAIREERFISYIAAPLIAKGQVNGMLEIWHRRPLQMDAEWLEFLESLTGQAAIAVDNAALYQQLQDSHAELLLSYDTTLEGWIKALDMRDKETEGHTRRVTEMTMQLAHAYPVEREQLVHIRRGALLHDIGKMAIPDAILHKPGPLTSQEWEIMRRHTVYAHNWISPIPYLRPAVDIPYCHHEKWDGSGYPRKLKGEAIPLSARLFSVVDVWDALRSDRPYRAGWPVEKVSDYIRECSGRHFDPNVVEVFLKSVAAPEIGVQARR